ncbi:MAG: pyrroline-5-carboxylate reductase [Gammaproteobacteria bacterium]
MTPTEKIAFIGCGNMGRSMIGGLVAAGYPAELIYGVEPVAAQRQAVAELGVRTLTEIDQSINDCAAIVLAVKPQAMSAALQQLGGLPKHAAPLLISIAAGVTVASISAGLKPDSAIVRVMPNTPALLQKGAAAMFGNKYVSSKQKQLADQIMQSVGIVVWLDKEELLDVVTAISGSGPAYFFLFIELLEKIARESGLDADSASTLTMQTALGAAAMVAAGEHTPAALRQQVTSPGGTTEQALKVLMDGRLEQVLQQAVKAAREQAVQLSGQVE